MSDVTPAREDAIKKALTDVSEAVERVRSATGAQDIYETIERMLPMGYHSIKEIESQLNDPSQSYQTVLELCDRFVDGWKGCLSKYLRITNANQQLAGELAERRKKPAKRR